MLFATKTRSFRFLYRRLRRWVVPTTRVSRVPVDGRCPCFAISDQVGIRARTALLLRRPNSKDRVRPKLLRQALTEIGFVGWRPALNHRMQLMRGGFDVGANRKPPLSDKTGAHMRGAEISSCVECPARGPGNISSQCPDFRFHQGFCAHDRQLAIEASRHECPEFDFVLGEVEVLLVHDIAGEPLGVGYWSGPRWMRLRRCGWVDRGGVGEIE